MVTGLDFSVMPWDAWSGHWIGPPSGEIVWFLNERGDLANASLEAALKFMRLRFRSGELRRVHEDGSPWIGDPFPEPPPPPLPDELIIGTLRGYRYWTPGMDGALYGRRSFAWLPGEWARAACGKGNPCPPCQDRCGTDGYGCGLYGSWTPAPVYKGEGNVWGVMEAKGRVVGHEHGFRAEYGRVIALCVPDGWRPQSVQSAEQRLPTAAEHALARAGGLKGAVSGGALPQDRYELIGALYQIPLLPRAALEAEYEPDPR